VCWKAANKQLQDALKLLAQVRSAGTDPAKYTNAAKTDAHQRNDSFN